jgi:UDP-glucose 4-epimerase
MIASKKRFSKPRRGGGSVRAASSDGGRLPERNALVTGAHGFVGRHVARALGASGYSVVGMGHGRWTREEWRSWGLADWHAADVTLDALATYAGEPELVVHCAGSASVAFSMIQPAQDFRRTVDSTVAVLEHARLRSPRTRIVMLSSGSVYGSVAGSVAEDAPTNPESPYAWHKLVAERLCREYGRIFGVSSAIVRLFSVHGPGLRKQLLWDACGKLARGESSFAGTGREVRDWIYVDDAVALLVAAGDRASPEVPIVNGGTGIPTSVAEVLEELVRAWGRDMTVSFSGQPRPGDPVGFVADTARARSWGWQPRVSWRDGVRAYVQWIERGAP